MITGPQAFMRSNLEQQPPPLALHTRLQTDIVSDTRAVTRT